ncbi:hypothetical protein DERP_011338 [Dermatophagoides pteronyssinus]|uniref:Uncharacterized protein n=1 Tax=Dermatophagoides pteronyssinus TaxID=6956 RepID=A0ABQ8J7C8_DERPT|nr:hypothetical protein DERP_011338 [Dermatophagoides pteronyssinus]
MWIDLSCCRNGHWSITFYKQGVDYNELYDVWKRKSIHSFIKYQLFTDEHFTIQRDYLILTEGYNK